MGKRIDITGQRFGRLTAIKPVKRPDSNLTYWLCKCDCGNETTVYFGSLRRGDTKSCGCIQKETLSAISKSHRKHNEYRIVDNTVYVKLTDSVEMLCNIDDWERLKDSYWMLNKQGYAYRKMPLVNKLVKFHIDVMGKREGLFVDHINRNRLDNRKENLRFVTPQENTWNLSTGKKNKSGVVGVYQRNNKWVASIGINRKTYHIGIYETIEEAILARKEAEKIYQPLPERIQPIKEDN